MDGKGFILRPGVFDRSSIGAVALARWQWIKIGGGQCDIFMRSIVEEAEEDARDEQGSCAQLNQIAIISWAIAEIELMHALIIG